VPLDFKKKKKHSLRFLHAWLGLTLSEQGSSESKLPLEPTWGGGHLLPELPAPPRVLPYRKKIIKKWHVWRIDECSHSPFCFQKEQVQIKSRYQTDKDWKIDGASLATWQAQDWNSNKILGFWKLWCISHLIHLCHQQTRSNWVGSHFPTHYLLLLLFFPRCLSLSQSSSKLIEEFFFKLLQNYGVVNWNNSSQLGV